MSWTTLRPQIKALLDTSSYLAEVSQAPKIKFNNYPSAHVVPSDNDSDYETNTENIRSYAFVIRVFDTSKDQGVENAMLAIEEVLDELLDMFDQEDLKPASTRLVGVNLPSNYTYINLWAVPGTWGEVPEEQLLMAEIRVSVRLSVDIT